MMDSRRGLTPLAIVLPHPPVPRKSRLSLNSTPRTPRSCPSPAFSLYPPNRKSTDSWNSSNADELEFDWQPDQVLLLTRTLDALPAHLVTPFHGPVPPSNLLDKIARGVANAKGPIDWPHSIRATRVKLLELARSRAKEDSRPAIQEEPELDEPRRPLYRQSSMDFIKPSAADVKDNQAIARLSSRLQRTDRTFPNPAFHPYTRPSRRSSSPPPSDVPSLINPSTPSTSTLSTLASFHRPLRRSASTLSTNSTSMLSASSGDVPQRTTSAHIPAPPIPPKTSSGIKRAPSYGKLAQEAKMEHDASGHAHARKLSGSYPSSDEEEKARTRHAKKLKTKTRSSLEHPSPTLDDPPPVPPKDRVVKSPKSRPKATVSSEAPLPNLPSNRHANKAVSPKTGKPKDKNSRPLPMNLQRNPSMFGPELPHLRNNNVHSSPFPVNRGGTVTPPLMCSPSPQSSIDNISNATPPMSPQTPSSPATQRVKTLRRVRRLPPARRISFGSLLTPGDEADAEGDGGARLNPTALGSAFQLS